MNKSYQSGHRTDRFHQPLIILSGLLFYCESVGTSEEGSPLLLSSERDLPDSF